MQMAASLYNDRRMPTNSSAPLPPHDTSLVRVEIYRGLERLEAPLTRFVLLCIESLLSSRAFLTLLAETTDVLPSDASPAQIDKLTTEIQNVIQKKNPLALESRSFPKPSTWARTSRTSSGASMYISVALVSALEDTSTAAPNAPLLATLALTAISHQLAHWIRCLLKLPLTPPMRHVSRFCSYGKNGTDDQIYGESGYALEAALWGGVVTALLPSKNDTQDGGHISAVELLCLEAGPLWSADEFRKGNGPPTKEYELATLHLSQRLHMIEDRKPLKFPLFDLASLALVGHEYDTYHRMRGECEGEASAAQRLLYGMRRPSACNSDVDPGSFVAFVNV
ncbi:hypothetical protein B0H12DRAFT_1091621 [Mycena haematopus]|nr:hypothetical protein B0H12DRAFT_1091621 [Mycena haematopus]